MSEHTNPRQYLRYFQKYVRAPQDELNNLPRKDGDNRERVRRETIRGRYGVFFSSLEEWINRQWRGYTIPRVGAWWLLVTGLMYHSFVSFNHTFYNMEQLGFRSHPNFQLLGAGWSYFYLLRPIFWTYMSYRLTKYLYVMIRRHWMGLDEDHYWYWHDNAYPDLMHSKEDFRYLNFRYSDTPVKPEDLTDFYKPETAAIQRFQKGTQRPGAFMINMDPTERRR